MTLGVIDKSGTSAVDAEQVLSVGFEPRNVPGGETAFLVTIASSAGFSKIEDGQRRTDTSQRRSSEPFTSVGGHMLGSSSVVYTALTLALAVSACAEAPTTASDGRMSVAISVGPVQVRSAQTAYVDAIIPLVVTNASAEAVFFHPCAPVLERSINGDWQPVFAQTCALDTNVNVEIPAGTRRTVEFPVRTGLGSGGGHQWMPPLDGVYRLRTSLRNARVMLPDSVGVTSSFRLPAQ